MTASSTTTAHDATRPSKRKRSVRSITPAKRRRSSLQPSEPSSNCCTQLWSSPPRYRVCSVALPTPPRLRSASLYTLPRRARSLDRSPGPQLLTRENLRSLQHSLQSSSSSEMSTAPRNPSPTRRDAALNDKKQLDGYNITIDVGAALPAELEAFVAQLRQRRKEEPSPHAQAIVDTRRAAAMEKEITAQKMMDEHILFRGEGHPGGVKGLALKDQVNLVKDFLPPPPRSTVPSLWGSLARPQPDSCIGYVTTAEAKAHVPALAMPLTREENDMAEWNNVVLSADTHFPFLNAQWKAAFSGENQVHAAIQSARDGALIVNYMHRFYSLAYPARAPTLLETCHFSVTCEGYTIKLWIHWREVDSVDGEVYYRMEEVETARMGTLEDLVGLRQILHNYLDFAMGERLRSIKAALPAFWPNRARKPKKAPSRGSKASCCYH